MHETDYQAKRPSTAVLTPMAIRITAQSGPTVRSSMTLSGARQGASTE